MVAATGPPRYKGPERQFMALNYCVACFVFSCLSTSIKLIAVLINGSLMLLLVLVLLPFDIKV